MRWPWRRPRSAEPRHALPRQRATWAQPALPPPLEPPPFEPLPPAAPQATVDSAFPAEVAAVRPSVGAVASDVRLGFADGSEVTLAAADPCAVALRAVADVLVRGER
jgi:hypothetical protein